MVRVSKRGLTLLATAQATFAQTKGFNPAEIARIVLELRNQLFKWIYEHDLYLFMLTLAVPMFILMYYDAKLVFRELRDITLYIMRRKELLPIEKRWYRWRMAMRAVGIVVLSFSVVLIAGALAWMGQFKHLSEMFAALDKMRREENILSILMKFLQSLRRR